MHLKQQLLVERLNKREVICVTPLYDMTRDFRNTENKK